MFLIDDILLAPLKGLIWLGENINDIAEKELSDDGKIKEKLMELQMKFELGEIDENEYDSREKELLERLNEIYSSKEKEI